MQENIYSRLCNEAGENLLFFILLLLREKNGSKLERQLQEKAENEKPVRNTACSMIHKDERKDQTRRSIKPLRQEPQKRERRKMLNSPARNGFFCLFLTIWKALLIVKA